MSYKEKLSDLPMYLRPLCNFPEHRQCFSIVPELNVQRPFDSPTKRYTLKTSYAQSFTPISSSPIKDAGKQMATSPLLPTKKIKSKSKDLSFAVEKLTQDNAIYGRKISPAAINKAIDIKPDNFEIAVENSNHLKISKSNNEWVKDRQKMKYTQVFNSGEYVPSTTQLQLYGRKEPKSKFVKYELWR